MLIWMCDLCKHTYGASDGLTEVRVGVSPVYHLCPDCLTELISFMNGDYKDKLKKIIEKAREPVELIDHRKAQCHECRHNKGGVCTSG